MAHTQTRAEQKFHELYRELNVEQRQAVDTIEGVVLVLAGPGTGKTQILAMRIAKILLETQMDPYNILCLTFTESGVAAMRKRLISIIGSTAYYVRIHTFHSFCNEVIREYPEKFTFARELEVLSDVERVEIFREIIDALPGTSPLKPFGNPYLFLPDITRNIASLKAEHVTSPAYEELLQTTQKFITTLEPDVESFLEKKVGARGAADVAALHQKLTHHSRTFPRAAAHAGRLAHLYARFEQAAASADNKREVGKAVTKYRNDLKRWFISLQSRLPKQQAMKTVYDRYQKKMQERGRYDYEDMILLVIEAFKRDQELLVRYQEQFQYILVDEYQDTNGAQNETVYLLGQFYDNPNIFVVGDDKQSIYRFQGASLENLLFLYERYRQYVQVIVLHDNYRSQQTILDASSAVIRHNQEALERYLPNIDQSLRAVRDYPPAPLVTTTFDTIDAETYGVCLAVEALIAQGVPPHEIAILYRRNADASDFVEGMLKLHLPIQLEHGSNILEDVVIRQLIMVLRYLADPLQEAVLWNILQYSFWQLPVLDVLKVQTYARKTKVGLLLVLGDTTHLQHSGLSDPARFMALAKQFADWKVRFANHSLPDAVAHVVNESGLLRYAMSDAANHLDVLNCLQGFFNEVKQLTRRNHTASLDHLLAHLDLLAAHGIVLPAPPLHTKREAVRLMTAHRAKGLEFAHVFIVRAHDHHWGNLREHNMVPLPHGLLHFDTIEGAENNEDERRLWYVAMTRAKWGLHISYARHNLAGREQVPAIFLEEIPTEHMLVRNQAEDANEARQRLEKMTVQPTAPPRDDRLRAYIQSLLDRHVMSVTHVNNYLVCPRLFYYRNLLRVPSVKTKHMAFGTAIHEALRDFYLQCSPTKKPSRKLLLDRFTHHLQREVLTQSEYKDAWEVGTQTLRDYYSAYHQTCSRDHLLEYNFSSHGCTIEGIPITGAIDKIEILDRRTRDVHVVDYKTGNPDAKRAELAIGGAYHRQLVFYKLLCDLSPRFDYTMRSGEIDFVQKSLKKNTFLKKKYVINHDDTTALVATIKEIWDEMHTLAFLDPTFKKHCGKCEYCLLHQRGQLAV